MLRLATVGSALLAVALASPATAQDLTGSIPSAPKGDLEFLISKHAAANNVPVDLVRRVIKRESRGRARVISKGNYGIMQIRLGTARAMGYRGSAAGLLDADTNMTYAVKYLAGAYKAAHGNSDRAVHYYAAGYYYAAKREGMTGTNAAGLNAFASAATTGSAGTSANKTAVADYNGRPELIP
ncbi:MAG TPA: lytic transglycosylase domain-containing protein [Pseudolabrys sp.]|nr:lytic transglycosylase domain-containing protein [Pseudolabrys sp.]